VWGASEYADGLHPYVRYRLYQTLLAALPLGIVGTLLVEWAPWAASAPSLPGIVVLPAMPSVPDASVSEPSWRWMQGVGLATLAGGGMALWRLGRLIRDTMATWHIRTAASDMPDASEVPMVDEIAEQLGLDRPVRVRWSRRAVVPVTLGGFRPLILLPSRLQDNADGRRMALVHECVHLRRYDDWAHVVERVMAALFAVHPLIYWLCDHIADERERACDLAVLNDGQAAASAYARLLADFATTPPSAPAGALTLSESSSLLNRLRAMRTPTSFRSYSPLSLLLGLCIVSAGLVFGVTACSDSVAPSTTASSSGEAAPETAGASDSTYTVVDTPPDCGGVRALQEHISYPEAAQKAGIEGRVFVQFIVDADGNTVDPTITKGVDETLDRAALQAVDQLSCEAGRRDGQPVRVKMALPVAFRLPDEAPTDSASDGEETAQGFPVPQEADGIRSLLLEKTMQDLRKRLDYPPLVEEAGIDGTVHVSFEVTQDGTTRSVRISKGVHPALNVEAKAAVQSLSFKSPSNGPREVTLPIRFDISEDQT
jgi:TonB family protein